MSISKQQQQQKRLYRAAIIMCSFLFLPQFWWFINCFFTTDVCLQLRSSERKCFLIFISLY